tara:strand:+ start:206 stop:1033 length:828 start_codon:yes stop_codon:yes gene_type:complete
MQKKILIIGYQNAALKNLFDALNFFYKKRVKIRIILKENFTKKFIENKSNVYQKFLTKIKPNEYKQIILGTSEKKLESNIFNFFYKKKMKIYSYVDSFPNIKLRYKNYQEIPKNILVTNSFIIHEFKKKFPKSKSFYFKNLNMPYQNYLKKNFFNKYRKDSYILYLSSNLKKEYELQGIEKMINAKGQSGKKIIFLLHPREKINKWNFLLKKYKNIKIYKNKNYYSSKFFKYVFGVSTIGLINYKFIGCEVFYFNVLKKHYIYNLFKKYNLKLLK